MLSQGFLHSPIGNLGNSQALALEQDISANPLPYQKPLIAAAVKRGPEEEGSAEQESVRRMRLVYDQSSEDDRPESFFRQTSPTPNLYISGRTPPNPRTGIFQCRPQDKETDASISSTTNRLIVIAGTRRMSLINPGSVTRIWLNQYFLSAVPRDHPLPFP
ncbi:unnamed protein product [Brassica oleracea]